MSEPISSPVSEYDGSGHVWVIVSSALLFLPAILSFFRQSLVVTIVFFCSALFSTMYHANDENNYEDLDLIWASLTILVALVMLCLIATKYVFWNWRVLLPLVFGVAGLLVYFLEGMQSTDPLQKDDSHYDLYHSLWHLFIAIAGTFLVWTPVNVAEANMSFSEIYIKILKNYTTNDFTERSLLK